MIQVTFNFKTIEEAVATLGTLLQRGAPVPNVDKPAADPFGKSSNRKPRADAGKKRGSYKNPEASATPNGEKTGDSSTAVTDPGKAAEQAANPTSTPADAPKGVKAPATNASGPETAAPAPEANASSATAQTPEPDAAAPDEKAVQAALDKVFAAKGLKPTMALLAEFGVAKGRDLKPEQRAAFVQKAEEAANG